MLPTAVGKVQIGRAVDGDHVATDVEPDRSRNARVRRFGCADNGAAHEQSSMASDSGTGRIAGDGVFGARAVDAVYRLTSIPPAASRARRSRSGWADSG